MENSQAAGSILPDRNQQELIKRFKQQQTDTTKEDFFSAPRYLMVSERMQWSTLMHYAAIQSKLANGL